jgi:hypothetical protein
VSKQTLIQMDCLIICDSISQEESHQIGSHVRAPDLCSRASALYHDIMEAMGWSSPTTFQSVYLKDVLVSRETTASKVISSAATALKGLPPARH